MTAGNSKWIKHIDKVQKNIQWICEEGELAIVVNTVFRKIQRWFQEGHDREGSNCQSQKVGRAQVLKDFEAGNESENMMGKYNCGRGEQQEYLGTRWFQM